MIQSKNMDCRQAVLADNNLFFISQYVEMPRGDPIEQVDLMEKVVLMIGMYELMYCLDTPWRVVLDEAVELAKKFGSEQGHTYVNAVLDKAAAGLGKV